MNRSIDQQTRRTLSSDLDLDGLNAAGMVALLTRQVVRRPRSVAATLDYFGLLGHPTAFSHVVASRHSITSRTLTNNVQAVRKVAASVSLPDVVRAELATDSAEDADHVARERIALVLGLPSPGRRQLRLPPAPRIPRQRRPGLLRERSAVGAAGRILAAVGPLAPETLVRALARSRRFRHQDSLDADRLVGELVLSATATRGEDGRLSAAPGIAPPATYARVVALAGDRTLSRQEMIAVLTDAGYSLNSAKGRFSSSHPLFSPVGTGRYRIVG